MTEAIPQPCPSRSELSLQTLDARFRASLDRYFSRRVRDRGEIEDLIQEVFLRLAKRGSLDDVDKIGGYVFETASNAHDGGPMMHVQPTAASPRMSGEQAPDRVRLPFAFDPDLLRRDLETIGRDWIDHLVRQNYEGSWSVLPLRHTAGATHPVMMIYSDPTATEFVDGPLLARTPYFREVLAQFRCPLHAARLMRLTPGSVIKPHRDHDLAAEWGTARVHIPITTNPDVEFLLNGTPLAMALGEAWYLRLADEHAVANRGTSDRVHLVIDCIVDDWLAAKLRQAAG